MRFGVRFPGRQLLRDQSPELAPHLADSGKTPDLISHARQSDNSRNPNTVRQTAAGGGSRAEKLPLPAFVSCTFLRKKGIRMRNLKQFKIAQSRSKYGARKVTFQGETFDSIRELDRYLQLLADRKDGRISGLRRQVRYELIPEQREPDVIGPKGGRRRGRIIERACFYVADFVYEDSAGDTVVEDCKGFRTKDYLIKRKLMLSVHGIRILET